MTVLWAGIGGIGIAAPGIDGWDAFRDAVNGGTLGSDAETALRAPERLPPNERRRTTRTIRLAFQAAEEALGRWGGEAGQLASVFASAHGDLDINVRICSMLAAGQAALSPTQFHNSVHNAPAGYWSIATGARGPSCSLAADEGSAAAGLLEAMQLVVAEAEPVLLVVYDIAPPAPLDQAIAGRHNAAVALILMPDTGAGRRLGLQLGEPAAAPTGGWLDGHTCAALQPLIEALARGERAARIAGDGLSLSLELVGA